MQPYDRAEPVGTRPGRPLLVALVVPVAVAALHLFAAYTLISMACDRGWFAFRLGGVDGARIIVLALTVISLVVAATATLATAGGWWGVGVEAKGGAPDAFAFLRTVGVLVHAVVLLYLVLSLVSLSLIELCQAPGVRP